MSADLKWSIQIDYDWQDDHGARRRGRTIFHITAPTIPKAYQAAQEAFSDRNVKFGAIIPGYHNGVF